MRNQAASASIATVAIAPILPPTIKPVLGSAEAVDAEEDGLSRGIAAMLSTTIVLIFGVSEAMAVEKDGISEIVETKKLSEALVVDRRKRVVVDRAAQTFSSPKTIQKKNPNSYHLCLSK